MTSSLRVAMLVFLCAAAEAAAQPPTGSQERIPDSAGRARLEGEIRRGFARLVRERVRLTDQQMRQLEPLSSRHEQQRRQLHLEERQTRTSLRELLRESRAPDSNRVGQLLQQLIDIQKRRVQLLEVEQRDLATIMTPFQRARYMALQEQVRRRLEQMRNRQGARDTRARESKRP